MTETGRITTVRYAIPSLRAVLVALVLVLLVACGPSPRKMGTLDGHVLIGPTSPVSREGIPDPTPDPRIFSPRQIVIYDADGRKEVARAQIDGAGNYSASLPEGTYVVDINHVGMDQGIDLPRPVHIVGAQVTRLDITIDTGVR